MLNSRMHPRNRYREQHGWAWLLEAERDEEDKRSQGAGGGDLRSDRLPGIPRLSDCLLRPRNPSSSNKLGLISLDWSLPAWAAWLP